MPTEYSCNKCGSYNNIEETTQHQIFIRCTDCGNIIRVIPKKVRIAETVIPEGKIILEN